MSTTERRIAELQALRGRHDAHVVAWREHLANSELPYSPSNGRSDHRCASLSRLLHVLVARREQLTASAESAAQRVNCERVLGSAEVLAKIHADGPIMPAKARGNAETRAIELLDRRAEARKRSAANARALDDESPHRDQQNATARDSSGDNGPRERRATDEERAALEGRDDPSRALKVLTIADLLTLEIPNRGAILSRWLLTQSLNMLHSFRGFGKTHVALGIGYAVATGGTFLTWKAERARPVLYLDGEMPAAALRDRLKALVEADERDFDPAMLRIVTPDVQDGPMPDLATAEGQLLVEAAIGDAELIIVDNISTLVRDTERENDAESWREVGAWALRMRQRGRSVLFVHHDGKSGEQRGTSKREDTLDAVIQLKRPADYTPDQGARFEIHFRKHRNSAGGAEVKPIEAKLTTGPDGRQAWIWRDIEDSTHDRVVALHADGLKPGEIAAELGVNKSTVSRHLKTAREYGEVANGAS